MLTPDRPSTHTLSDVLRDYRKPLILLVGLLLVVLATVVVLSQFRLPLVAIDPYEAMPANAPIVMQFTASVATQDTLGETAYGQAFRDFAPMTSLREDFARMDSVFGEHSRHRLLRRRARITSGAQINGQQVNFVHIIDDLERPLDLPELLDSIGQAHYSSYTFKSTRTYEITLPSGVALTLAEYNNLLLVARHSYLVEDAVEQLEKPDSNLLSSAGFSRLATSTTDLGDLVMHINFGELPLLVRTAFSSALEADALGRHLDWMGLTMLFEPTGVRGSGLLIPEAGGLLQLLSNLEAPSQPSGLVQVLPDNTSLYLEYRALGMADALPDGLYRDFDAYVQPWLSSSFARVLLEPVDSRQLEAMQFLALQTTDAAQARALLQAYADKRGEVGTSRYDMFEIVQLVDNSLLRPFLGNSIENYAAPYCAIVGDYVLFSGSLNALETVAARYVSGRTMAGDADHLAFLQELPNDGQCYLYLNTRRLRTPFRSSLRANFKQEANVLFDYFTRFDAIGLKVMSSRGGLALPTTLYTRYQPDARDDTRILWRTSLDAAVATRPDILTPPGERPRIFVQDLNHTLYCIDHTGQVLWRNRLDGPLLSSVQAIDVYGTGSRQVVMNTETRIYLFGMDGLPVAGYPVPLRSRASAGLRVIYFDDIKAYHYYLPCKNGNFYGYRANAEPLPNFGPMEDVGVVSYPVQHMLADGKDYFVLLNEAGQLHVFDRLAKRYFPPKAILNPVQSAPGIGQFGTSRRIVVGDAFGRGHVIGVGGNSFGLDLATGRSDNVYFEYADVYGDGNRDYITLNSKTLIVRYYDGKDFRIAYKYQAPVSQTAIFTVASREHEQRLVGTFAADKQQITLLQPNGEPYPYFPIRGTTPFALADLLDEGKDALIVGVGDEVHVYKLGE